MNEQELQELKEILSTGTPTQWQLFNRVVALLDEVELAYSVNKDIGEFLQRVMDHRDQLEQENERLQKVLRIVSDERDTYKQAVEGFRKAFEALDEQS